MCNILHFIFQGGDVVEETLYANVTKDIVILEFQRSDGTLVTQLSDFTNEVLVLRALVLGEEERGQNQYQVLCFILADQTSDLIPSEAISKLRQKNPGALRVPEEDRGKEAFDFNLQMSPSEGGMLSPLLEDFCSEAQHSTYLREQDWIGWQEQRGQ
ncbi:unnamed protein product [Darwinula stevensoni]|uniref:Out at first protein BRICHOS-like domain-containing protein n=1 Tax=Darwinula stevensoni TaxID=69355 RepID=A0A7R8ZXY5_9CRUS|nr:unnamed protein product [Darwinula stevensoni]CAG0879359.1 unnamed protein product [Darwinula stevensoni]